MKKYSGNFLKDAIDRLIKEGYIVFAPVKVDGYHVFKQVESSEEADFSYINTRNSAKIVVFPENEVLIKYKEWIEEVPVNDKNMAIVGIRACDAKAIRLLDRIFLEDVTDTYYQARREKTLLIGYACKEAGDYCFCLSLGIKPYESKDVDIFVSDLEDKQILDIITKEGEEFAEKFELDKLSEDELKAKKELEERVVKSFTKSVNIDNIVDRMKNSFDSEYWKEVASNCVSCGVCTYLCPTCYCFDIYDDGEHEGARIRAWDSCQFPLHTLESSSHNPRREKWQRLRNRFYDKFYQMVVRKGEIYCVGCGRCIEFCPVGIDIAEVISNAGVNK